MSAGSTPAIVASYSDWLLVVLKPNLTACLILSPVGEVNCRPMIAPDYLKAPFMQSVHQPFFSGQVSGCEIYARKSTKTFSFFESLNLYWMTYSLNSIAQRVILPDR